MNTNYTKIHTRFFNDFIWCNQFGKRGYAYAMKSAVVIPYTEHSQQVRELKPQLSPTITLASLLFLSLIVGDRVRSFHTI